MLWRVGSPFTEPDDFVLTTSTGRKHNPSNLRRDVLAPAVEGANFELEKAAITQVGAITFHSLRRTYASLRCACCDDVAYTSAQIGHTDPRFTLRCYTQATQAARTPLRAAFAGVRPGTRMGTNGHYRADEPLLIPEEATKNPA